MTNEQIKTENLRALIRIAKDMWYTQKYIAWIMGVDQVTVINFKKWYKARNLRKMRDALEEFLLSQVHKARQEHIEAMDRIERDIRAWSIEKLKNSLELKN